MQVAAREPKTAQVSGRLWAAGQCHPHGPQGGRGQREGGQRVGGPADVRSGQRWPETALCQGDTAAHAFHHQDR